MKFSVPTIARWAGLCGATNQVDVYGLLLVTATPMITPSSGPFTSSVQVTIIDTTAGSTIHYTTDGSTPTQTHGKIYKIPFTLKSSATVQAMAVTAKHANNDVASEKLYNSTVIVMSGGQPSM